MNIENTFMRNEDEDILLFDNQRIFVLIIAFLEVHKILKQNLF